MKLDPDIHIVMHSVLSLKSGVTVVPTFQIRNTWCRTQRYMPPFTDRFMALTCHDISFPNRLRLEREVGVVHTSILS